MVKVCLLPAMFHMNMVEHMQIILKDVVCNRPTTCAEHTYLYVIHTVNGWWSRTEVWSTPWDHNDGLDMWAHIYSSKVMCMTIHDLQKW